MIQQVLVGCAVLLAVGLKEGYDFARVYWLENPDTTFAEIRATLEEVDKGIAQLERHATTRLAALVVVDRDDRDYRRVNELKQEREACHRIYLFLKYDLRKNFAQRLRLVFSDKQLLSDIHRLWDRVHELERDWLRTSSVLLYDWDPDDFYPAW